MTVAELDALAFSDALALVGGVAENAPWVAEEALRTRPFGSIAGTIAAFTRAIVDAPVTRRRSLAAGHPDLAGRAAIAGELTPESTAEQASAGLDRLTAAEFARFTSLNDAYRERFGFPFVICVREHTKRSILAAFETRLRNSPDDELATATGEVVKIVALRLNALLTDR